MAPGAREFLIESAVGCRLFTRCVSVPTLAQRRDAAEGGGDRALRRLDTALGPPSVHEQAENTRVRPRPYPFLGLQQHCAPSIVTPQAGGWDQERMRR
ncbi:hypothetical protein [Sphingomonas sp. SORGH_AS_0879]|uniref:hypothetical protein n=1 Tax=Sphingomonas sp. SORGH_AS_0879 TaxID=3041790 RepID=UPI0027D8D7FE|nr:hypothetical protein [Sphingomonas sp. SORGH_AS_0879]